MSKTGLLILSQPLHVTKSKVAVYLREMNKAVEKTLYIHIQPSCMTPTVDYTKFQIHKTPFTLEVRNLVKTLYSSSAELCSKLDVRVLLGHFANEPTDVPSYKLSQLLDVVWVDSHHRVDTDVTKTPFLSTVKQCFNAQSTSEHVILCNNLPQTNDDADPGSKEEDSESAETGDQKQLIETYNHIVLGGTFDRLHIGHKLLLTEGCLLSEKILTVGVTDKEMNAKKVLCELIEPVDVRINALLEFLKDVKPGLDYRLVPIYEMLGPTITDDTMDLIVLSQETLKGGEIINKEREKVGMKRLLEYTIELVEDLCHSQYEEEKVSSSSLRKRLLGTLYNPLKAGVTGSERPYIIGLTGGIASGKSAICKRLEGQGAVSIDCDKLGHKAYLKGTRGFEKVVEVFGEDIVGEDGEVDRKLLGPKVFSDKEQLKKLNSIVWPEIADLAKSEILRYSKEGKSVVVLDAAILLEAGWDSMVHEVWLTIVPPAEAVKRMIDRNNLTEDQAKQRLQSQLSNKERVQKSNVVLSSLWEYEYTQSQVEKAWSLLQHRMGGQQKIQKSSKM